MSTPTNRDERGAVAIMVALLAVVLFGFGALAVDIGQAYAKKSLLQTDVDLAVLAAAAQLSSSGDCNPEVVQTATDYLTKAENKVPGQYTLNLGGSAGDTDGFIECKNWKVTLWAPKSRVDFSLAQVLPGAPSGIDVGSVAAAQIKSAGKLATLPYFAVQGCDKGQQSIRNDSQMPSTPVVPALTPPTGTPANAASFTISPGSVPSGLGAQTLTVNNGKKLKDATKVYFSNASGQNFIADIPGAPIGNVSSFTVGVPASVLATDDTWFVRILIGTQLSTESEAQPFVVGPPKLYCDAKNQGNFGTLRIPRTDTTNAVIERNIILGVEPTLAIHPLPVLDCSGKPGSVESTKAPVDGTNCLETLPGLKIAETNAGLITGKDGLKGRLDTDSTSNCSRDGNSARTQAQIKSININDDVLTCFITNGAHIQDLVDGNVVGAGALSSDIFKSPRFFWLPVLKTDPTNGGSGTYSIIGFVPGFISDQAMSATQSSPGSISPLDGLEQDSSGISELKLILFSPKALPDFAPTVGGESDYTGSGPKALVLVE